MRADGTGFRPETRNFACTAMAAALRLLAACMLSAMVVLSAPAAAQRQEPVEVILTFPESRPTSPDDLLHGYCEYVERPGGKAFLTAIFRLRRDLFPAAIEAWREHVGTLLDFDPMLWGCLSFDDRDRADSLYAARLRGLREPRWTREYRQLPWLPPSDPAGRADVGLPGPSAGIAGAPPQGAAAPGPPAAEPEPVPDLAEQREAEIERRRVEQERLRVQAEADERWRRLQEETERHRAESQAARERYERGVREAEEARERYERDMARHRDELSRNEAEQEAYRRQLAEAGTPRPGRDREDPVVGFEEGIVLCESPRHPSREWRCQGPLQVVYAQVDGTSVPSNIALACGSDAPRYMGVFAGHVAYGCNFGINSRLPQVPGNSDVPARLGISVPGRQTFYCRRSKQSYCSTRTQ